MPQSLKCIKCKQPLKKDEKVFQKNFGYMIHTGEFDFKANAPLVEFERANELELRHAKCSDGPSAQEILDELEKRMQQELDQKVLAINNSINKELLEIEDAIEQITDASALRYEIVKTLIRIRKELSLDGDITTPPPDPP